MSTQVAPPEVEQRHGYSLEQAITEFVKIQNRYAELAEEKKRVMEILIPAAQEVRQGKTSRLENHNKTVVLKAEFGEDYRCDVNGLNEAREMLGDDVFEELFKTEYKPKMRGLKPFLGSKSTDERVETAKEQIKQSMALYAKTPSFTVEKGSV